MGNNQVKQKYINDIQNNVEYDSYEIFKLNKNINNNIPANINIVKLFFFNSFIFSNVNPYIINSIAAITLVIIGYQFPVNFMYLCIITAVTVTTIFKIAINIQ